MWKGYTLWKFYKILKLGKEILLMRKKILVFTLAAIVGASSLPVTGISAKGINMQAAKDEEDESDDLEDWEDEEDEPDNSGELTKGDIVVSPAKKTIKIGKSFYIDLYPSTEVDEMYADLPDEEWEELLEENIDDITYRSSKSSVASVSTSGKVKGRKKGSAVIKTTVTFRDGSEGTYKTKVYVTR